MALFTPTDVVAATTETAQSLGIDPLLALATVQQEDPGFSPTAVGDQGTSFGPFQLHIGGELGNLPGNLTQQEAEAQDPYTAAPVAEGAIASVAKAHPSWTPGQIAAAAQRPADPTGYAAAVDAHYANLATQVGEPSSTDLAPATLAAASTSGSSSSGSWLGRLWKAISGGSKLGPILGPVGGAIGSAAGSAAGGLLSGWEDFALRAIFVVAGLGLILLGLTRMFPGVSRTVVSAVPAAAALAA